MSNGTIGAGENGPPGTNNQPRAEHVNRGSSRNAVGEPDIPRRSTNSGAMSHQSGFSYTGNASSQQQLLHLVGCRDPKARPGERLVPPLRR